MKPHPFRSRKALAAASVVTVGLCLAAATATAFLGMDSGTLRVVLATAAPTFVLGMLWAALLRWDRTVAQGKLRLGWLLSIPLAMWNGAFAAGLLFAMEQRGGEWLWRFLGGMLAGATFGAIFWIPGLLLTLLFFGLPIARAQRLASQGLAGRERGDGVVGVASAVIAACALLLGFTVARETDGVVAARVLALLGVAAGGVTATMAALRARARRAFVAEVEAGRVPEFRVDAAPEGKVLVRVVSQTQNYRVGDYEEEVASLDREGAVVRSAAGE